MVDANVLQLNDVACKQAKSIGLRLNKPNKKQSIINPDPSYIV